MGQLVDADSSASIIRGALEFSARGLNKSHRARQAAFSRMNE